MRLFRRQTVVCALIVSHAWRAGPGVKLARKGGAEFYTANVAEEALFVLPEPAGVLSKQQCVEAIRQSPRWASVQFDDVRLIEVDGTTTMLVYKAQGKLGDGTAYAVLGSSSYLVGDGSWLLVFHQQTPN